MTKTELEDDFDKCFDKNTSPTGGGYEADWTDRNGLWNDFKPAVEIFAKQEAIEFFHFVINFNPTHYLIDSGSIEITKSYLSIENLYEKFIQSKETNNG